MIQVILKRKHMLIKSKFTKLFCLTIIFYLVLIGSIFLATSISGLNYVSSKPFSSNLTLLISLAVALLVPFISIGIIYTIIEQRYIHLKQIYQLSCIFLIVPFLLFLVVSINLSLQYQNIIFPGLIYAILGLLLGPTFVVFFLNITVTAFSSWAIFRLFYYENISTIK